MQQAVERRVWSPRSEETYTRNVRISITWSGSLVAVDRVEFLHS